MPALALFSVATLLPVPLLVMAALQGGIWVLAGFLYMSLLTGLLDEVIHRVTPPSSDAEFPAADALSVVLALSHLLLLVLTLVALGGDTLSTLGKVGLVAAVGLFFGQVSNSNAHELIHKGNRTLHRLGMWVYISILFGHHTSAHVLVHHRLVATPDDPSTARLGESSYRFFVRAWVGSFREGYRAEAARLARVGRGRLHNPYVLYVGGGAVMILAAIVIGGWKALLGYLVLCLHAQAQLILTDYVQHYGLARPARANGKPGPVGAHHSWNSPHWFSSALMLNAPRHSDHHAHPTRPFPSLRIGEDSPMLPRALPVMVCLALAPRLWRRVMDPRARKWAAS